MERKLRRKFILVSMSALFLVLLLLAAGINLTSYWVSTEAQDDILRSIAQSGHPLPTRLPDGPFGRPPSPEARSMLRFFMVRLDGNGQILHITLDHISSVTREDAIVYVSRVRAGGRQSGYCGEYRYYVCQDGQETIQVFLNSSSQLQFLKNLMLLSLFTMFLCLLVMFILVYFLSGRAISPYVKNMTAQKQFITNASHELKTPLTSISTSADILALDDENNEWILNIQRQTRRLSRLIENLITLSRLNEELPIPEKTEFSLSEVLEESILPFLSVARAGGKKLETQIEKDLVIRADQAAIRQMLSLLLDNALKYSDENGYIRLDACRRKKKIVIELFNTCHRINTGETERLFERFYRPDQSRSGQTGGAGVGLSIARAIARAHGGDITVKSRSGNSICFTVVL